MEIKPCPFCGNSFVGLVTDENYITKHITYFIKCNECSAESDKSEFRGIAILNWNRVSDIVSQYNKENNNE